MISIARASAVYVVFLLLALSFGIAIVTAATADISASYTVIQDDDAQ